MTAQVATRRNIDSLSVQELTSLKTAYKKMQGITDNRGFNYISGFHGVTGHYCHDESPYKTFLPWHRAYLYWFELHLRDIDLALAVPYWDWTSAKSHTSGIPDACRNAKEPDGSSNPLYSFVIDTPGIKRSTVRSPGIPAELDSTDTQATPNRINELLAIDDFMDFSQDLEQLPHNAIHVWVAGDMGYTNFAAFDPIFYSHHSMIDFIWLQWQKRHGTTNIPAELLARPLAPFSMNVQDVLDISSLGYNYE